MKRILLMAVAMVAIFFQGQSVFYFDASSPLRSSTVPLPLPVAHYCDDLQQWF